MNSKLFALLSTFVICGTTYGMEGKTRVVKSKERLKQQLTYFAGRPASLMAQNTCDNVPQKTGAGSNDPMSDADEVRSTQSDRDGLYTPLALVCDNEPEQQEATPEQADYIHLSATNKEIHCGCTLHMQKAINPGYTLRDLSQWMGISKSELRKQRARFGLTPEQFLYLVPELREVELALAKENQNTPTESASSKPFSLTSWTVVRLSDLEKAQPVSQAHAPALTLALPDDGPEELPSPTISDQELADGMRNLFGYNSIKNDQKDDPEEVHGSFALLEQDDPAFDTVQEKNARAKHWPKRP